MRKNPAKFDRCVKKVKAKGGAANAYAVCTTAGTRRKNKRKRNPADASAEAFKEFHGRPSEEVITFTRKVHFHGHLAALGQLIALKGDTLRGDKFTIKGLGKNCMLCMNEKKTQLFIEGGSQTVANLKDYGATAEHELYTLGQLRVVEYFTRKDHLGSEGGTAIYVHRFHSPYPTLLYDAPNQQLLIGGGSYDMPPEGIDH